ncbi:MAG: DUF1972 domain-containing protein [Pseudomonadota bacterium]
MDLNILGTRGIPPAHGGFETFASALSRHLVTRNWRVNVYCQDDEGRYADGNQDEWKGVTRTHFRAKRPGPLGSMEFDLKCVRHVLGMPGIDLVLGYNTAIFCVLQRLKGRRIIMNMDGIEWKRLKWSMGPKAWFFINEIIGANLANVTITDHPEISRHVAARCFDVPLMIPYGGDEIRQADPELLAPFGVIPDRYLISVARIEPENSILELVQGAAAMPEGYKLLILGKCDPANAYHNAVLAAGGDHVLFAGAYYDPAIVRALRFHTRGHLHGHQVGGTNPSLVEALGAGNAVIAHDNRFNRWTAGDEQLFFSDVAGVAKAITTLCTDNVHTRAARIAARARHATQFRWDGVLRAYEDVLVAEHARIGCTNSPRPV